MNRNLQSSTAMLEVLAAGVALVAPLSLASVAAGINPARRTRRAKKNGVAVRYAKPVPEGPHIAYRPVKVASFGPDHPIRRRFINWDKKEALNG